MPPKPKFSKEKIIKTAYKIIKKEGINSLTARSIGNKLESSARPIFTVFKNMEEVKASVREKVLKEFFHFIKNTSSENITLLEIAKKTVIYAIIEPDLFKVLFTWGITAENQSGASVCNLNGIEDIYIDVITEEYNIDRLEANLFFEKIWINIFGMATLVMGKVIVLPEEEIEIKISQDINSIVQALNLNIGEENVEIEEQLEEWVDSSEGFVIEQEEEKPKEKNKEEKIFSWLD